MSLQSTSIMLFVVSEVRMVKNTLGIRNPSAEVPRLSGQASYMVSCYSSWVAVKQLSAPADMWRGHIIRGRLTRDGLGCVKKTPAIPLHVTSISPQGRGCGKWGQEWREGDGTSCGVLQLISLSTDGSSSSSSGYVTVTVQHFYNYKWTLKWRFAFAFIVTDQLCIIAFHR